jgi:rhodanese-related sulfurtransferase
MSAARKLLVAAVAALSLLGAAGCGGDDSATATQATTGVEAPAAAAATFETVAVTAVAPRVDAGDVLLVDVREDGEWVAGHAPKAIHVPLGDVAERLGEIEKAAAGRPVAFICRSGNRSAQAAQIAVDGGLRNVINVDGGMGAWVSAGLPLDPSDGTVV